MEPPDDSPDWAWSCHPHSRTAVWHADGGIREHSLPTTLGWQARDSPCRVPSPCMGNQRWLKRDGLGLSLSHPMSHSTPPSPYGDVLRGLHSISTSRGNASYPEPGSSNPMFNHRERHTSRVACVGFYSEQAKVEFSPEG